MWAYCVPGMVSDVLGGRIHSSKLSLEFPGVCVGGDLTEPLHPLEREIVRAQRGVTTWKATQGNFYPLLKILK